MATILVVDDDAGMREALTQLLELAGYRVMCASNGKNGLLTFRTEHPDLVITDIVMPEKDGLEMIRDIHRDEPDMRILAISGSDYGGSYLAAARAFGACDALAKPIGAAELLRCVRDCITRH